MQNPTLVCFTNHSTMKIFSVLNDVPVELSPHVSTQSSKDNGSAVAFVSVHEEDEDGTSSCFSRRRDSTSTNSSSLIEDDCDDQEEWSHSNLFPTEAPTISFQGLSLQREVPLFSIGCSKIMGSTLSKPNRTAVARKLRKKQQQNQHAQESLSRPSLSLFSVVEKSEERTDLTPRENPFFSSTVSAVRTVSDASLANNASIECVLSASLPAQKTMSPFDVQRQEQQLSATSAKPKRQRGGSDFVMTDVSESDPFDSSSRCKRRRLNRNRALIGQEFDSILSQINATGNY
jgi:hypothetical protein